MMRRRSMMGGGEPARHLLVTTPGSSPYIHAYEWTDEGFGSKFSNPSTLPAGADDTSFSPEGSAVLVSSLSGGLEAYEWSPSGFGAKYSAPASPPPGASLITACFNPAGTVVVAGPRSSFSSGKPQAYEWSDAAGFGAKYSAPSAAPSSDYSAYSVQFNASGDLFVMGGNRSPFLQAYNWDDTTGFGSLVPASITPSSFPDEIVLFDTGSYTFLAAALSSSPYIYACILDNTNGFFGKRSDPSIDPAGRGYGITASPNSDVVVVAHAISPFVTAWAWSGTNFGAKFANPSIPLQSGDGRAVKFSTSGDTLFIGTANSPYLHAYAWSASGFGAKYANPTTLPPGAPSILDYRGAK